MLKKYIWFLIDKVLFLESFLTREKAKKLLQTVMKIVIERRIVSNKGSASGTSLKGVEWGEVSPALFQKLEKRALIWRKNALIVVIYG